MCLKISPAKSRPFFQEEMNKMWIYPILYTLLLRLIDFNNWLIWRNTWEVVDVSGDISMDGATVTSSSSSSACVKTSKEPLSKYLTGDIRERYPYLVETPWRWEFSAHDNTTGWSHSPKSEAMHQCNMRVVTRWNETPMLYLGMLLETAHSCHQVNDRPAHDWCSALLDNQ